MTRSSFTIFASSVSNCSGPGSSFSSCKTFRVPLHLLSLGHVTVTAVRATSAPTDPNTANDTANDTATKTCHVISIILATC
ncbi:hypothetical protein [Streptosporangium sp. NPDC050280]|uniref:hypothetical protein n=1 Tax=unclassified Streptosporangium TaxID=2632669 RepID=UPI00342365BE